MCKIANYDVKFVPRQRICGYGSTVAAQGRRLGLNLPNANYRNFLSSSRSRVLNDLTWKLTIYLGIKLTILLISLINAGKGRQKERASKCS